MDDIKIWTGVLALIAGLYGWLIKHISSSKKHPCSNDIVYKDVCDSEMKRVEDCLSGDIENLKEYSKERFDRIEDLIKNGR